MNRNVAMVLMAVFFVLSTIAGFAWINNVHIAFSWDPEKGHSADYKGFITQFDRFAVDFSTVSTLIPFLGCLFIAVGFHRIYTAKEGSSTSIYFPFFKSYISINIALGLMGTVWGLIMIGSYPPNKVNMPELMDCLRTALYSTLIALMWTFLFVLPIRYLMQLGHRVVSNYQAKESTEDILKFLNQLGSTSLTASRGLTKIVGVFTSLAEEVKKSETALKANVKILTEYKDKVVKIFARTEEATKQMQSESQAWQKAAEEQQRTWKDFRKELSSEREFRRVAEKIATEAEQERDRVKTRLNTMTDCIRKALP